jgi:dimethylglycine dehydrogenase
MAQLKTDVRALVVGGGAVGTGIAYHLQKAGWDTDAAERDELTAAPPGTRPGSCRSST